VIVAGVMSGTSADGIDVALVRIPGRKNPSGKVPGRANGSSVQLKDTNSIFTLIAHEEYPFAAPVRRAILEAMNAESASVADLAHLNFLLGELYADAIAKTVRKQRAKINLVGCHGQTIYHQGEPRKFLGRKIIATWQTGEGAIIAARLGVPVVSDFRPADIAAGGKGAPLVPFLDYLLYRDPRTGSAARNRIVQNIGGIANLTVIPAGASPQQLIAFDTGPGNMLIDALMESFFAKRYDRDGKIAAQGDVLKNVALKLLRAPYFRQKPPRTAGREEFGRDYAAHFIDLCPGAKSNDMVATATFLTAQSIADAVEHFALPCFTAKKSSSTEIIISGGGAKNPTLIAMLRTALQPLSISVHLSDEFGLPAGAKEAVAFALLAHETWQHRPSNVPSATGAKHPAILGKISYA
jgi:anhydro-N-acetylmuramic acid kinase